MPFEVENKFVVADLPDLQRRLEELGAQPRESERHVDWYFQHPLRDLRQTDEAIRIRQSNDNVSITYKGPRAEAAVKIREEFEISLVANPTSLEQALSLFERLGFRPLAEVHKHRTLYEWSAEGKPVTICLDEVRGLGEFAEIELVVEAGDLEAAKKSVESLQASLALGQPLKSSYLKMHLAQRAMTVPSTVVHENNSRD